MINRRPLVILIGPSGVGKSTFLERLISELRILRDVITYTTRPKRQGESEGNPYHFVTVDRFHQLKSQGFFVEDAEVHGNFYGTPRDQMEAAWSQGLGLIMDVDVQGANNLRQEYPEALTIFILPPNIDSLRNRLLSREAKAPRDMDLRLRNAEEELAHAHEFDHQLVNDEVEVAYQRLKKLIEDYLKNR